MRVRGLYCFRCDIFADRRRGGTGYLFAVAFIGGTKHGLSF